MRRVEPKKRGGYASAKSSCRPSASASLKGRSAPQQHESAGSAVLRTVGGIREGCGYLLGTWRRTHFSPDIFPQALNGAGSVAHLDDLDAEYGNVWRFVFLNDEGHFILECTNPGPGTAKDSGDHGSSAFLTPDLSLDPHRGRAAVLELIPYPPFREGPTDVGLMIKAEASDLVLCSAESTKSVHLLTQHEANTTKTGEAGCCGWVYNIAWEATPDEDIALELGEYAH
ncbi:unnamed protein product [Vitrella brassicaformis CCMP3155]|uniref:Uncharacterized protein n=2 Tax=Vitrella brassicaformis TaxID=1169539 RepID=A0A0G4EZM9_VITBC|nr:unnamed protein product [Vitrella brassicaformis CCMP3155]|eukprot:CEM04975.1 unnamed protein product [Vitrella brassicaformis CCMP3155]